MDTKLKNRHRLSLLLAVITVLAAALVMVGLYPYFENESNRYREPVYEEESFLRHLVSGNYVLALETAANDGGEVLSPFRFFFPKAAEELKNDTGNQAGLSETQGEDECDPAAFFAGNGLEEKAGTGPEEEIETEPGPEFLGNVNAGYNGAADGTESRSDYLKELRRSCMDSYESWSRDFGSIRNYLDYQVLDKDGKVLSDHASGVPIPGNGEYIFKAVFRYDDSGRMDVSEISGKNKVGILNTLQTFGDLDPMRNSYWDAYLYEPDLKLVNPRNITVAYGMRQQQMDSLEEARSSIWNSYDNSGSVFRIFMGLACAVGILAFLFSFLDAGLAEECRILRMPFELVSIAAGGSIAFGSGLIRLVAVTNRGDLYEALLLANFLPRVADLMVRLWNLLWWSMPFAIVYWAVLCVRDVLHIGVIRYLKERTLFGWFCSWIMGISRRVYRFVSDVNLKNPSDRTIFRMVGVNFIILAVVCSLWYFGIGALVIYSVVLFLVMRKYYRDLSEKYGILLNATNQIAEGNLEVVIEEDLGVFEPFKKEIQKIQSGFKVAVDEEVKSQKLKTDLISNMSHDLKTPLTAIITYVNLLRDERVTPEQRKAYIDILEQKSMRLKSLIEDLFEISKANSNNVTLDLADVDIVSLLKEVSLELSDKIEESTIDFRWNLPDEKIVLPLDSQKTYRIFDNLLTNIMKYAMPHTRAYIDMKKERGYVIISLKNVSAAELTFNPEEITERFARGDQSRNTEGSGLGMAIAKSFVELQNGKLFVETEADLFRVLIRWPVDEGKISSKE